MNHSILEHIDSPKDIKKLTEQELPILCRELRETMIETTSRTGGHLASNLGVVELTVALHRIFDSPQDKIVWDVGHQCYAHKLLTGRRKQFSTLRQKDGLSGFPKPTESPHDAFVAGHASTSISAASGMARAKTLHGDEHTVIAVIGDGAFTSGLAYEAINNAARSGDHLIVILNDNEMSISKNESNLAKYLSTIRSRPNYFKMKDQVQSVCHKIPLIGPSAERFLLKTKNIMKTVIYGSNFFEDLGFHYLGPVDGHDLNQLSVVLNRAKSLKRPVFLHVKTQKGKGYSYAEKNPGEFHGTPGFEVATGVTKGKPGATNFSNEFGKYLTELAKKDERICAITAAMKYGTGLNFFSKEFKAKGRFFDVGIAEPHAVTFAGGLAAEGMLPVFAVYSSFLQRCYDGLIHDLSIVRQHVVLGIDRAGIVGADGETHNGLFDVAMLLNIPKITLYSPATYRELRWAMDQALYHEDGVCGVRYPRGGESSSLLPLEAEKNWTLLPSSEKSEQTDNLIVTYGRISADVLQAVKRLEQEGTAVSVLKLTKIFPIGEEVIKTMMLYQHILFVEEGIEIGGLGQYLGAELLKQDFKGQYRVRAVSSRFVPQATVDEATQLCRLDAASIAEDYRKYFSSK